MDLARINELMEKMAAKRKVGLQGERAETKIRQTRPKVIQAVADGRSYRWIARDLGINKNTVFEIMKRPREKSL